MCSFNRFVVAGIETYNLSYNELVRTAMHIICDIMITIYSETPTRSPAGFRPLSLEFLSYTHTVRSDCLRAQDNFFR